MRADACACVVARIGAVLLPLLRARMRLAVRGACVVGIVSLLVICLDAPANAAEAYLCVADKATGFYFNERTKSWGPTNFRTESKFVLRRATPQDKITDEETFVWVVQELGKSFPSAFCPQEFSNSGFIRCSSAEDFQFSRRTMRYLRAYLFGYIWEDTNSDTPSLEIGRCTRFDN